MNKKLLLLLAFITVLLAGYFGFIYYPSHHQVSTPVITMPEDTLRFKVVQLQNEIAQLNEQRQALQQDTIKYYNKYHELLARIGRNKSDSAQYEITKELLNVPDPQTWQVNEALAKGEFCCDLLQNTELQLHNADSTSQLKDTIIVTQKIELNDYKTTLTGALVNVELQKQTITKTKGKLHNWRTASLFQSIAIVASITIYKFSH